MSFTKKSYPLDANQRSHHTTQHKLMMHYVNSGDRRTREQLEYLAQKNAGTDSKHFRKLPIKKYTCVCMCVSSLISYDHGQQTVQLYIHSCIFSHCMNRNSFNFIIPWTTEIWTAEVYQNMTHIYEL